MNYTQKGLSLIYQKIAFTWKLFPIFFQFVAIKTYGIFVEQSIFYSQLEFLPDRELILT